MWIFITALLVIAVAQIRKNVIEKISFDANESNDQDSMIVEEEEEDDDEEGDKGYKDSEREYENLSNEISQEEQYELYSSVVGSRSRAGLKFDDQND
ncbi:Regulatory protein RecX [Dirofilaria immitis]